LPSSTSCTSWESSSLAIFIIDGLVEAPHLAELIQELTLVFDFKGRYLERGLRPGRKLGGRVADLLTRCSELKYLELRVRCSHGEEVMCEDGAAGRMTLEMVAEMPWAGQLEEITMEYGGEQSWDV
jgi:hypothetical protein